MSNRKIELGGVLSKGGKNLKSEYTLKTKREIVEECVVCTEPLIPYINLVCLNKPVYIYIKFSYMTDSSSQQIATWVSLKKKKKKKL